MIYEILSGLSRELSSLTKLPAVIEPSSVEPESPHLRIEALVPTLNMVGDTVREFGDRLYEAKLYDILIPVRIFLAAEGQEEVLKKQLWDAAFALSFYFVGTKVFQLSETLEWPGSFALEISEVQAEFPIQRTEVGTHPYRFLQGWVGNVHTRYFAVISATAQLKEAIVRGDIQNL